MKFNLGDLVMVTSQSPIYSIFPSKPIVGIISDKARLMYVHLSTSDKVLIEFWAYEVYVNGQRFDNVPEEGLRSLKNVDEEDSE